MPALTQSKWKYPGLKPVSLVRVVTGLKPGASTLCFRRMLPPYACRLAWSWTHEISSSYQWKLYALPPRLALRAEGPSGGFVFERWPSYEAFQSL